MPDEPLSAYPALAEPLVIGKRTMRNRIVQAPLSVCYQSEEGSVTDRTVAHYSRRARGGVGMVITENFAVDISGRQLPLHGMISDESYLPGLTRLAEAIRAEGALAILQIAHAGRYAGPWNEYESRRRLAPSALPFELTPGRVVTPAEITLEEITMVQSAFARAGRLAEQAGFDGIHFHGGQGFLLCAFQSPRTNVRGDAYGGDFDGRNRFALEAVDALRDAVSDDFIVGYHLLSDEMLPGGWTPADAARFAALLPAHGVDFISPAPTTFESLRMLMASKPAVSPTAYNAETVGAIVASTSVPVFANGELNDPDVSAQIVASGAATAVMQGRGLLADPDWALKTLSGRYDEVNRCACSPPTCIGSQMTGVICHSWPTEALERGFLG